MSNVQARLSATFSAPYTTTTLVCLMASVECALVGVCIKHNTSAWSLGFGIRLIAAIYAVSFSNFIHRTDQVHVGNFGTIQVTVIDMLENFPGRCMFCTGVLHNVVVHPEEGSSLRLGVHPFAARHNRGPQLGPSSGETRPGNVHTISSYYYSIDLRPSAYRTLQYPGFNSSCFCSDAWDRF